MFAGYAARALLSICVCVNTRAVYRRKGRTVHYKRTGWTDQWSGRGDRRIALCTGASLHLISQLGSCRGSVLANLSLLLIKGESLVEVISETRDIHPMDAGLTLGQRLHH